MELSLQSTDFLMKQVGCLWLLVSHKVSYLSLFLIILPVTVRKYYGITFVYRQIIYNICLFKIELVIFESNLLFFLHFLLSCVYLQLIL